MRNALKKSQSIVLASTDSKTATKELTIVGVIGMGANVIAYEATDRTGQIHYVLKECFPENGAERLPDGSICWKSPEVEDNAKSRMKRAYEMQLTIQNEASAENTNTHLVDTIYRAFIIVGVTRSDYYLVKLAIIIPLAVCTKPVFPMTK